MKEYSPENAPVDIEVKVSFEDEEAVEKLSLIGTVFSIYDMNDKVVYVDTLQEDGHVKVYDLAPNRYTFQAVRLYEREEYNTRLGRNEDFDVNFSTAKTPYTVNPNQPNSFDLKLLPGNYSPLVIKQIYYAGSNSRQGAGFRDQFMEVYNNSEQVQYADGLYIGEAFGTTNQSATYLYQTNSKQYDWSKSYGMPATINANRDYVYARVVLQLPGNGTTYPILPGESIIIAATALNHQSPYVDVKGNQVTVRDPSLTVDLSGADFEVFLDNRGVASDLDNTSVPNVVVHRIFGAEWIMSATANQSWFIFRADGMGEYADWPKYAQPYTDGRIIGVNDGYAQIPVSLILDAIELQSATSTKFPKKFSAINDAGEKFVEGGAYSSNSIIRITKEIKNGQRILEDTNNSTKDFVTIKAQPRAFVD